MFKWQNNIGIIHTEDEVDDAHLYIKLESGHKNAIHSFIHLTSTLWIMIQVVTALFIVVVGVLS